MVTPAGLRLSLCARCSGRVRRVARLQQVDERVQAVDDLYALGGHVFAGEVDDIVVGDGAELLPEGGFLREGFLIKRPE